MKLPVYKTKPVITKTYIFYMQTGSEMFGDEHI